MSQRSWTWHLAWELLPIALLLNLLEKNRHPDYLHYGCQSPQWIPQTIEIKVGPWFCDRTYLSSTRLDLRWILLCPNTFCDGSYFVQTLSLRWDPTLSKSLFAMDPTLSKSNFLRWILLCPNTFCDGSWLCLKTLGFCDGSYFVQTVWFCDGIWVGQIHLKHSLQVRLTGIGSGHVSQTIWGILCHLSQMQCW